MGASSVTGTGYGSAEGPVRGLGPVHKILQQTEPLPAFALDDIDPLTIRATGGGLEAVVDDTSPQLGGNLDVNGFEIISIDNGDIVISPDGTGEIVLDGQSWPQTDGTEGQVIQTDGAGQLSWNTLQGNDITLNFEEPENAVTLTIDDNVVLCDASSSPFAVTLPLAADATGKMFRVKKIDASENAVSVTGSEDDDALIDGDIFAVMEDQWECITITSNGTDWFII